MHEFIKPLIGIEDISFILILHSKGNHKNAHIRVQQNQHPREWTKKPSVQ